MPGPIVYIDRSSIETEQLAELRGAIDRLVDFVKQGQPQLLLYSFFLDERAKEMTVVAVHPNSASLARHLAMGGAEFRKVGEYIDLQQIDVYGAASDDVVRQLEAKAGLLGRAAKLFVHVEASGFSHLPG